MAKNCEKQKSYLYGFEFNQVPTVKIGIHGSAVKHNPESYSMILDNVYGMALNVGSIYSVDYSTEIDNILRDEDWKILPSHRKLILNKLEGE